jgi:hypothetical protein
MFPLSGGGADAFLVFDAVVMDAVQYFVKTVGDVVKVP